MNIIHFIEYYSIIGIFMKEKNIKKEKLRKFLFIGGAFVFAIAIAVSYFLGGRFISTDDAFIKAARVDISSNIPGRITKIFVKENQLVQKGEPLFQLDDREYKIAVDEAKANLENERLKIKALKASYKQSQADSISAKATLAYMKKEYTRQKKLFLSHSVSQSSLDLAQHNYDKAKKSLQALLEEQNRIQSLLGDDIGKNIDAHPNVQHALAALDEVRLKLSYTIIKAPMEGFVTKVDQYHAGSYINAAKPLFSLMSDKDIWIVANFKETQITHMNLAQNAIITVDAYPDKVFKGSVESFSSGTGSSFSLLPPENATGNWVKVVQRLPVRIKLTHLDKKIQLHTGLSVNVEVDTHHNRLQDFL